MQGASRWFCKIYCGKAVIVRLIKSFRKGFCEYDKNHKFDLLKMTIDITKIVCYTNWRNKAIFLGSDTCGSTE